MLDGNKKLSIYPSCTELNLLMKERKKDRVKIIYCWTLHKTEKKILIK